MNRLRGIGRAAVPAVLALGWLAVAAPAAGKPKPKPRPPPTTAQPQPQPQAARTSIDVAVVQVAGTQAYVQPGESGGVHRGAKVTINGREYPVVQATASFAVIEVGDQPPHEQDKGRSTVVGEEAEKPAELPPPRPVTTWEHAWPEAAAPASTQTPRFVPLGGQERNRQLDVSLALLVGGIVPLGQRGAGISETELNARIHAEPFAAPAAFDVDASFLGWLAADLSSRAGSSARPLLWVRQATFSYGSGGWLGSVGRMRYAAATLGTLDGARVQAPLGSGFSMGAFGGFLPNPLGGEPSLDAQRFGVETTYSRPDLDLRPEAALVLHGSTFNGSLDERRASGVFALYPGLARLSGHFEVSNFDPNNPWKAKSIELTAAGVDASVRKGIFELGGRFDIQQPIRSRWLASFLPASWFCRTVPAAGAPPNPEPCDGSVSTIAVGTVDTGIDVDHFSVVVGGTTTGDLTQTGGAPHIYGGFATGRVLRIAKILRLDASGSYSKSTYIDMFAASGGPGLTLFDDNLDMSVYYRHASLQYRAFPTTLTQEGIGGAFMLFPTSVLLFTLQGEAVTGSDVQALLLFGSVVWHPRL